MGEGAIAFSWDYWDDKDRARYIWRWEDVLQWWQWALEEGWNRTEAASRGADDVWAPRTPDDEGLKAALEALGGGWWRNCGKGPDGVPLYWDPFHLPLFDPHTGELTPKHLDYEGSDRWTGETLAAFTKALWTRMRAGNSPDDRAPLQGIVIPPRTDLSLPDDGDDHGDREDGRLNPRLYTDFSRSLIAHQFAIRRRRFGCERARHSGAGFATARFGEHADLSGADLWRADLSGAVLWRANLSGAFLRDADLSGAELQHADLSGAFLPEADLSGANLFQADLSGADLFHADLSGAAVLLGADLSGAALERADLSGAVLLRADLSGAFLPDADLSGAHLPEADLSGARLMGADLSGAFLPDADLSGADLSRARLQPLPKAKPEGASDRDPFPPPRPAYLYQAKLVRADLESTDLTGADLSGADITGATLTNSKWGGVNAAGMKYDPKLLRGKCYGVGGPSDIFGDAQFRRDVMDQDYVDTLHQHLQWRRPSVKWAWKPKHRLLKAVKTGTGFVLDLLSGVRRPDLIVLGAVLGLVLGWIVQPQSAADVPFWNTGELIPPALKLGAAFGAGLALFFAGWWGKRFGLWLWDRMDNGRSWVSVLMFAAGAIALFGWAYQAAEGTLVAFPLPDETALAAVSDPRSHPAYPWYVAAIGFCTLGIADMVVPENGAGQLLIIANVAAGFATLGLLLAVLADRFARRA